MGNYTRTGILLRIYVTLREIKKPHAFDGEGLSALVKEGN